MAKFFYKLAKYTFAGRVIGAVVSQPSEWWKLAISGMVATFLFAGLGYRLDGLKERRK